MKRTTKACLKCGKEWPISEYHEKRGKPQPQCKECRSEYMRGYYQDNYDRERAKRKAWYEANKLRVCEQLKEEYKANPEKYKWQRLKQKYGVTQEQYEGLRKMQRNKCGICRTSFDETEPHLDHCHDTGKVRGLLCANCNTGIGLFKHNAKRMEKAIAYVVKYKK